MNTDTSQQVYPSVIETVKDFDRRENLVQYESTHGMTLLQYYAGQALPALILSSSKYCSNESGNFDFVVDEALDYADWMVKQYNKRYGG